MAPRSFALSILFLVTLAVAASSLDAYGQEKKKFDPNQARLSFKAGSAEYFEFIGDGLAGLEAEKRPDTYWLVTIRPKRSGHFAVKYVFKYNDPFYSEGENVINFRVGPKICGRQSSAEAGIAGFCLGDTVILPIRAANRYDYSFSLKYTEESEQETKKSYWACGSLDGIDLKTCASAINNPLAANLTYLGTQRAEMLHRNSGSTVIYSASFQAVKPGRFNLLLSAGSENTTVSLRPEARSGGVPVLILEPGTPISHLASHEDVINYADDKKFSSHSGGTFPTNVLILQPGDVFSLSFLTIRTGKEVKKLPLADKAAAPWVPDPVIQKAPFFIDREWGYNQFVADYLQ